MNDQNKNQGQNTGTGSDRSGQPKRDHQQQQGGDRSRQPGETDRDDKSSDNNDRSGSETNR